MKKKKNKRTLKKRIRRVMSLSAFITVVTLSGLLISIILYASNKLAIYQADEICNKIQMNINSGEANRYLNIDDIEELKAGDELTNRWINGIIENSLLYEIDPFDMNVNKIYLQIVVRNRIVYSNYDNDYGKWGKFFSDTEAKKIMIDHIKNEEIGSISVKVNPRVLIPLVGTLLGIVIGLSILVLMISKIFSMFLTIPIINPLRQLEKKVKALADGDHETALNTELVLKRPLREIESLANSTNSIMKKLHGYNEILEQQKEVLENQYAELEEQNDELISSKLQIEEQQAQLIQSEKMASVGLLTAAITHEINTPIGAINSNAQISDMLLNELMNQVTEQDSDIKIQFTQLKEINDINLTACERIIEIIKSLKSYSRLDQAEFQEADINESINSVLVLTNNLIKNRITVHKNLGDLPSVQCFPGQLNQVFMNVIVNASQAINDEGEIYISTYKEGDYLLITIRDTGAGISPENLNKIFEPGFTTKGVGVGLGIGLYLSYNIIQNHKGEITVTSEVGKGTQFMIKIPIYHNLPESTIENTAGE